MALEVGHKVLAEALLLFRRYHHIQSRDIRLVLAASLWKKVPLLPQLAALHDDALNMFFCSSRVQP